MFLALLFTECVNQLQRERYRAVSSSPDGKTVRDNSVVIQFNCLFCHLLHRAVQHQFNQLESLKDIGIYELNMGRSAEAAKHFKQAADLIPVVEGRRLATISSDSKARIYLKCAVAYLRMAEDENCVHCTDGTACIIPFAPEAPATMLLTAVEWQPLDVFRVTPNVLFIDYDETPEGDQPPSDLSLRLTLFFDFE